MHYGFQGIECLKLALSEKKITKNRNSKMEHLVTSCLILITVLPYSTYLSLDSISIFNDLIETYSENETPRLYIHTFLFGSTPSK